MPIRKEFKKIEGFNFCFSYPTVGSMIELKTELLRRSRGTLHMMQTSLDPTMKDAFNRLQVLANLDVHVGKCLKDSKDIDLDFSFFDLEDEQWPLVEKVQKEYEAFVEKFRKANSPTE